MPVIVGLVAGSLSIVLVWLFLAVVFTGLGLWFRRGFGITSVHADACLQAFWMGLSAVIGFLQVWHCVFAVTWHAQVILCVGGGIGLIRSSPAVWRWLKEHDFSSAWRPLCVLFLMVLWLANRASGSGNVGDNGLYHIPSVVWAKTFPIVPGLGNLHGRLAFNNAHHLYVALLDVGLWPGHAHHLANGLFLAVLLVQIGISARRLRQGQAAQRGCAVFYVVLAAPLITLALLRQSGHIASAMTDLPTTVLLFIASAQLFSTLLVAAENRRLQAYHMLCTTTLLALAVCVKLSALALAVPSGLLAIGIWLQRARPHSLRACMPLLWVGGMVVVLAGVWAMRGVILSGYPAYPSRFARAPVAWRVPAAQAAAEAAWIAHFARWAHDPERWTSGWILTPHGQWSYDPQRSALGWHWFPGWLSALMYNVDYREMIIVPALLVLGTGSLCLARCWSNTAQCRSRRQGWWLVVPTLLGMLWWFCTAPSPRFGGHLFWLLAAITIAQTVQASGVTAPRQLLIAVLLLSLLPLSLRVLGSFSWTRADLLYTMVQRFVVLPTSDHWLHPLPTPQVNLFTTVSGLTLYVPEQGRGCWAAALPCTPHPAVNLRLRNPDRLQEGFQTTDGQWRQERFPDFRAYARRQQPVQP